MSHFLFEHLKFQIAAAIVMIVLEVVYGFRPKLRLRSTKVFIALMTSSAIYLVFDFLTVYGLVNYDYLPHAVVDWFHRGFIFFLDLTILFVYSYMEIISHKQKNLRPIKIILILISMGFAIVMLIVAPIKYHIAANGIYSYGPMVNSVYVIITIYTASTLIASIKNLVRDVHNRTALYTMLTMLVWSSFALIQLFKPATLISSLGVASMILMMYLSLQTPSSYMDKETDCFNISGFKLKLQDLLYNKKDFHIINIELESFEAIQNQLGDETAIKIVSEIKAFLKTVIHKPCYRTSEECLTIIIKGKQLTQAQDFLNQIEKRFKERWTINEYFKLTVPAHVDYIRVPEDLDHKYTASGLIKFIKHCHLYSTSKDFVRKVDDGLLKKMKREEDVLKLIKTAIAEDGIEMYYQPIFNTQKNSFTNVEALVRLKDDRTCGFVSPEEFIPLAERHFMIVELSNLIFNHIFDFIAKNDLKNLGVTHVEVNLSAIQSVDASLPSMLMDLLSQYKINPDIVNLEVTESVAVSSAQMLRNNMKQLKHYGCSFSMDDFGTGYSNLSQIVNADFEFIKIDKSLLWPIFKPASNKIDKQKSKILLETMIKMIHDMDLEIVVEGVEDKVQKDYLMDLNVDYMQGYEFSRPIREKEYLEFLKKNNKVPVKK